MANAAAAFPLTTNVDYKNLASYSELLATESKGAIEVAPNHTREAHAQALIRQKAEYKALNLNRGCVLLSTLRFSGQQSSRELIGKSEAVHVRVYVPSV